MSDPVLGIRPAPVQTAESQVVVGPTVHVRRSRVVADATPIKDGSKPALAKSPIGKGSAATPPTSPAGVPKDQTPQDPVSQLKAEIADYQKKLTDDLRKNNPEEWAQIQSDLGDAHLMLGEALLMLGDAFPVSDNLDDGTKELNKAIDALSAAEKVLTSKKAPKDWLLIQSSKGNALSLIGLHERKIKLLRDATEIFRAAINFANDPKKVAKDDYINWVINLLEQELKSTESMIEQLRKLDNSKKYY